MIIHKSTACGYTPAASIFAHEMVFQFCQLIMMIDEIFFDFNFSVIVGEVSLINVPKTFLGKVNEPINVLVGSEGFSNVVNLAFCIQFYGIRKENDVLSFVNLWRDVDEFPFWRLPYAMKDRLDKDPPPVENVPTNFLFSAIGGNMLWDNVETFIDWLASNRAKWNDNRNGR